MQTCYTLHYLGYSQALIKHARHISVIHLSGNSRAPKREYCNILNTMLIFNNRLIFNIILIIKKVNI
jgi:hypothetical protein